MAYRANLTIDQGTDYSTTVTLTDDNGDALDLSTYTGAAQMRKHFSSSVSYNFSVSTSNNGVVTLSMNSYVSNTIPAGRYVYDCELTSSTNTISRVVEGIVTIKPGVTR